MDEEKVFPEFESEPQASCATATSTEENVNKAESAPQSFAPADFGTGAGEYAIRTYDLTKAYAGRTVVNHVSLNVKRGEVYGFIGNNGAGKSTVIRMLTGLAVPTSGSFEIFGQCSQRGISEGMKKTGAIIEVPSLYLNMTARENLKCRGLLLGKKDDENKILQRIGLQNVDKKRVKDFSLGMKQRLAIGMAIYGDPQLLILDEPINGLDPAGIFEVRELLRDLNTHLGTTVFVSSHILGELAKVATAYGVIANGNLVREMTNEEVKSVCRTFIRIVVDDAGKAIEVLDEEMSIRNVERFENNVIRIYEHLDDLPRINQSLNKHDVLVLSSEVAGDDTEEFFVKLMGGAE